jgi:hypothetical protein
MSPLARTGVCQGNFAASVKKILPIYQRGTLAVAASTQGRWAHEYRQFTAPTA